jgi:hypothetical protein
MFLPSAIVVLIGNGNNFHVTLLSHQRCAEKMAGGFSQREVAFLLSACAPDRAGARLEPPDPQFDWGWLERAAGWHGVIPLVARALAISGGLAHPIGDHIIRQAAAVDLRNRYLVERLTELVDELARAGVHTLAIKGPVLAQLAYGEVGLRAFADLDLLVCKSDVPGVVGLLTRIGFTAEGYDEEPFLSGFFDTVAVNFRSRDGDFNLDLHWDLSPNSYPFGPRGTAVWERAIVVTVAGKQVQTLGPEDHLLYLAVHASRHGWPMLSQICDIAHFTNRVKLDAAAAAERAASTGCARMLNLGLLLTAALLEAESPHGLIEAANAKTVATAYAIAATFNAKQALVDSPIRSLRRSTLGLESALARARSLIARTLAPTLLDWRYYPLPRRFYPAYYLIRPLRVIARLRGSFKKNWTRRGLFA